MQRAYNAFAYVVDGAGELLTLLHRDLPPAGREDEAEQVDAEFDGKLNIRPGAAQDPDLILRGSPQLIVGTLTGKLPLRQAEARGLTYEGDPVALERLHTRAAPEFAAANTAAP